MFTLLVFVCCVVPSLALKMAASVPTMDRKNIVIIGGGIIGTSTAYHLAKRGVGCTLVERCEIAAAASGKAAGFLAFDWCDDSAYGPLARRSFALHEQLANEFGHDVIDYRRIGALAMSAVEPSGNVRTRDSAIKGTPWWIDKTNVVGTKTLANIGECAQVHPRKLSKKFMEEATKKANASVIIGIAEGLVLEDEGDTKQRVKGVKLAGGQVLPADVVGTLDV